VSTATEEEKIDLQAVNANLAKLEKSIATSTDKHNQFLVELGQLPLP
jgi:type I restriction enzyme M protein